MDYWTKTGGECVDDKGDKVSHYYKSLSQANNGAIGCLSLLRNELHLASYLQAQTLPKFDAAVDCQTYCENSRDCEAYMIHLKPFEVAFISVSIEHPHRLIMWPMVSIPK